MIVDTEVDLFLEHFGVRGMRWGHRKAQKDNQPKSSKKTLKVLGTAAGVIAIGAGALYMQQHMAKNKRVSLARAREATEMAEQSQRYWAAMEKSGIGNYSAARITNQNRRSIEVAKAYKKFGK